MTRALWACGVVVWVVVLSLPASGDVFAVAKPETQAAAISGSVASFDGSDSYTEERMRSTDRQGRLTSPIFRGRTQVEVALPCPGEEVRCGA